ncbi:MAG: LysM peptidoglycan-binding domain-containing protein [Caldilineaceae bacterium]|nr:LysM peptidoglycan-binding domain-containing protein [Caldilineaceae bacterium]
MTTTASYENLLANGSFEHGFTYQNGCGEVGSNWGCFTNGGLAGYGFYDDQWEEVVADGKHSQLIEINTKGLAAADPDRYAGIYQTVRVVDREKYKFSMKGMIRTTDMEGDPWRYRVQFGWTQGPKADWKSVENWVDAGWDTYYERTSPGMFSNFETMLMPGAEVITLYVRVWKKWGTPFQELDVNLDSIALVGPSARMPHGGGEMQKPAPMPDMDKHMGGEPRTMRNPEPPMQQPQHPMPNKPVVCGGENLVYNGSFEHGFNRVALGDVGKSWGAFTNGGAANYGFYDDQWEKVVADGYHSQLIEINSKRMYPTDPDRYAGIYQLIGGLKPGATYELSLRGMLRGAGNEDDPYRFEAEWGFNPGPDNDWQHVQNWEGMDLGPIYERTKPGAMGSYTVRFEAPSQKIMLFIRGWKKWAITDVEMDFNVDAIRMTACWSEEGHKMMQPEGREQTMPQSGQMQQGGMQQGQMMPETRPGSQACQYVIRSGDSLARIARDHGVSTEALAQANDIKNPSVIFAGKTLQIPGCQKDSPAMGQEPQMPQMPMGGQTMAADRQPEPMQPMQPAQPMQPMQPMPSQTMDRQHQPMGEMGGGMSGGMSGGMMPQPDRTYKVRAGDSLSAIAAKYDTTVHALAAVNNIGNVNILYVGQLLQIP